MTKVCMKSIKYFSSAIIALFLLSCEPEVQQKPSAEIVSSKTSLSINESVEFTFTGNANQVVVYTGDKEHDYEKRSSLITGFVVNKNIFSYAYKMPGTYKVVFVASTYSDGGINLLQDTCSVVINVIDNNTSITKISCPQILYDEVFGTKVNNDWLIKLPRKILFNNREVTVSSLQRLNIVLGSDSSKLYLNESPFKTTDKYELSSPLNFKVRANSGDEQTGKLYMLYYPEFSTFKISNSDGIVVRDVYSYNQLGVNITVPVGIDISDIAPAFTTISSSDKVFIGNTEQISGVTKVNFTQAVEYTIVSEVAGKPELKAETKFRVKVTRQ